MSIKNRKNIKRTNRKSNRRKDRRSNRKSNRRKDRRSNRKSNRRKDRRSNRRKDRRSNKKSNRRKDRRSNRKSNRKDRRSNKNYGGSAPDWRKESQEHLDIISAQQERAQVEYLESAAAAQAENEAARAAAAAERALIAKNKLPREDALTELERPRPFAATKGDEQAREIIREAEESTGSDSPEPPAPSWVTSPDFVPVDRQVIFPGQSTVDKDLEDFVGQSVEADLQKAEGRKVAPIGQHRGEGSKGVPDPPQSLEEKPPEPPGYGQRPVRGKRIPMVGAVQGNTGKSVATVSGKKRRNPVTGVFSGESKIIDLETQEIQRQAESHNLRGKIISIINELSYNDESGMNKFIVDNAVSIIKEHEITDITDEDIKEAVEEARSKWISHGGVEAEVNRSIRSHELDKTRKALAEAEEAARQREELRHRRQGRLGTQQRPVTTPSGTVNPRKFSSVPDTFSSSIGEYPTQRTEERAERKFARKEKRDKIKQNKDLRAAGGNVLLAPLPRHAEAVAKLTQLQADAARVAAEEEAAPDAAEEEAARVAAEEEASRVAAEEEAARVAAEEEAARVAAEGEAAADAADAADDAEEEDDEQRILSFPKRRNISGSFPEREVDTINQPFRGSSSLPDNPAEVGRSTQEVRGLIREGLEQHRLDLQHEDNSDSTSGVTDSSEPTSRRSNLSVQNEDIQQDDGNDGSTTTVTDSSDPTSRVERQQVPENVGIQRPEDSDHSTSAVSASSEATDPIKDNKIVDTKILSIKDLIDEVDRNINKVGMCIGNPF